MKFANFMLIHLISTVVIVVGYFILCGFCWPYAINMVLHFMGKPEAAIAFWQGGLLGFVPVIGQLGIPAAAVVWILRFFL